MTRNWRYSKPADDWEQIWWLHPADNWYIMATPDGLYVVSHLSTVHCVFDTLDEAKAVYLLLWPGETT